MVVSLTHCVKHLSSIPDFRHRECIYDAFPGRLIRAYLNDIAVVPGFLPFCNFSIKLATPDRLRFSFCHLASILPFLPFPPSCRLIVFCFLAELCTPFRVGRLPGRRNESTSAIDYRNLPPHSVVEYIEGYLFCLDSRRFAAMPLAGNVKEIHDLRTGRMQDTAVGAWIRQWWHWGE